MNQVQNLIAGYGSIYNFILESESISREIKNIGDTETKIMQLPHNTEEFERKISIFNQYKKELIRRSRSFMTDFRKDYPEIYKMYILQDPPEDIVFATIQAGKLYSDALLYDILLDPELDIDLLNRYKEVSNISEKQLSDFIIKRDIHTRVDLLVDVAADPNYVTSVEMARSLTEKFPNYCGNIENLYKVNDLKGVEKYLNETKCTLLDLTIPFYESFRYIVDMKAYDHVIRQAKKKGLDIDVDSTIFYLLQNRNHKLVIDKLKQENVRDLSQEEYNRIGIFSDLGEMTSEVMEYLIDEVKNTPFELFIDDGYFYLSSPPSPRLIKIITNMQLDNPVVHKILPWFQTRKL